MAVDEAWEPVRTTPAGAGPTGRRVLRCAWRWLTTPVKWFCAWFCAGLYITGGFGIQPLPQRPLPWDAAQDPEQSSAQDASPLAPGHPERLIPEVPPTAEERELWVQLAGLGQAHPGGRPRRAR